MHNIIRFLRVNCQCQNHKIPAVFKKILVNLYNLIYKRTENALKSGKCGTISALFFIKKRFDKARGETACFSRKWNKIQWKNENTKNFEKNIDILLKIHQIACKGLPDAAKRYIMDTEYGVV